MSKLTPSALYVHQAALEELDPVLRLYEGCARNYIGAVEGANLIKLHRGAPQISYLSYPDFDTDPHPAIRSSSGRSSAFGSGSEAPTPRRCCSRLPFPR